MSERDELVGRLSTTSETTPSPPGVMKRIVWPFCQEPLKYKPSPKADVHLV